MEFKWCHIVEYNVKFIFCFVKKGRCYVLNYILYGASSWRQFYVLVVY